MNTDKIKPPAEEIVSSEPLISMCNAERFLREKKFVVKLACGHLCHTSNLKRVVCPRCTVMLRRSVKDGSEDYESFRKGLVQDRMDWPDDPCVQFNQPQS